MKKKRRKNRILNEILDWSRTILTALAIAFVISHTLIANAQVPTGSMETTIMTGSRILINRLAYVNEDPQRGDIVSFYLPDGSGFPYLKRIIGLPGETVEGIDGRVYIDGEMLDPDYTDVELEEDFGPYTVPENSYFMMGDNRNNSWDSRFWDDKFVEKKEIIGRAEVEYYPEIKKL